MEFNEKLQKLRTDKNLTQEELAEKLFVSRTAISKWESGRGYPSIDSLKVIAEFFHVTIDDLIGGAEMVTLAEQDKKESGRKTTVLICGILDSLAVLLLILPIFGNGGTESVSSVALPSLTQISGNILLHAELCRDEAAQRVRDILDQNYGFEIPFALFAADMLEEDMQTIPPWWSEPFARKDALFPTEGTDYDKVKADIAAMPLGDEIIHFGRHVILWGKRDERTYSRTAYHRLLIRKPYYRGLTIRNGNTFDQIMKWIR